MGSSLIFLGTGGDAIVIGKQIRASGGIILKIDDTQFHIDPGPGSLVMAKNSNINLRENTAILVSHFHIDHCNDVNAVISAMTLNGLDQIGVLVCNKKVNEDSCITKYHLGLFEKVIFVEPGNKIGINDIDIEITNTKESGAVGFKFLAPKFVLSYVSDTDYSEELAKEHSDCHILIINCKNPNSIEEQGHFNREKAIKLISRVRPDLAILTHFGIKMINADPIQEAREIQKITGIQIIAAKDGLAINPESHAKSVKQKSLRSFVKK